MRAGATSLEEVFEELKGKGVLLDADAKLPSVARMVIGGPFKGSWWAHPLCHPIYMLGRKLAHHPDVIYVKLLCGKMTFIHRRMWPDLYVVATSGEPWQFAGMSDSATELLRRVRKSGRLRTDEVRASRLRETLGADARRLELNLLVYSEELHTETGAHTKVLETWESWASRVGLVPPAAAVESAKASFDRIVMAAASDGPGGALLPWHKRAGPSREGTRTRR